MISRALLVPRVRYLPDVPVLGIIIPNMGIEREGAPGAANSSALADALFTSVQQRVLALLFGQPERRFLSSELIRMADSGTGATHRIVKRFAYAGLVREEVEGRQKYYQANPDSPVFEELVGLVRKTVGLVGPLRVALSRLGHRVHAAFVYGSVAAGAERAGSDIDLMVIADDLDYPTLYEAVEPLERQLGRAVNPNLMTLEEWRRKRSEPRDFTARIEVRPRLFVVGSEDDLR